MYEKPKILIVGLGIGSLYRKELEKYEKYEDTYTILTVDPDPLKEANYPQTSGFRFIQDTNFFELVIICSPNHLHEEHIRLFAPISKNILVEKPGVETSKKWKRLCQDFPKTKIIMSKNNIYRCDKHSVESINYFKDKNNIYITWNNNNRIPFPGGWFTNKDLAFGGVSYDLLPHLLHFMFLISETTDYKIIHGWKKQKFHLNDIDSTDYGTINKKDGIFNVDDTAHLSIECGDKNFIIETCWKYSGKDERAIFCDKKFTWNFGLCPDSAYLNQVNCLLSGDKKDHYKIDINVLKIIESLEEI